MEYKLLFNIIGEDFSVHADGLEDIFSRYNKEDISQILLNGEVVWDSEETQLVYKLFTENNDGSLSPLFIDAKRKLPIGEWMKAECIPTKGFAVRQGWHCTYTKHAPHLKMNLANGKKRIWCLCEVKDTQEYNRPESQGGKWVLAQQLKIVEVVRFS